MKPLKLKVSLSKSNTRDDSSYEKKKKCSVFLVTSLSPVINLYPFIWEEIFVVFYFKSSVKNLQFNLGDTGAGRGGEQQYGLLSKMVISTFPFKIYFREFFVTYFSNQFILLAAYL